MEYTLIRSERKTVALSVNKNLEVVVKAPTRMLKKDIDAFVNKHIDWIEKHTKRMAERAQNVAQNALTVEEKQALVKQAEEVLPERIKHFKTLMGVQPTAIKITAATTRWGSCSGKNSVCFSYRIMLLPIDIVDYIIVHEFAHILEKNHSSKFYAVVERFMPDYKQRVKRMKEIEKTLPF